MASVFDHPWLSGLFGDDELAAHWSAEAQLAHMRAFEAAWSRAGHLAGLWSEAEGEAAARAIETCNLAPADLADGAQRDGVCVPDLVLRLKAVAGTAVHKGATSQDVIDTSLVVALKPTLVVMEARLTALGISLDKLRARFGPAPLMGRTRMQAAVPIDAGDRIATWRRPIADHLDRLAEFRPRLLRVQIGGAAGNRAGLGERADEFVAQVARTLGLNPAPAQWHVNREAVAELAGWLSLVTGSLGKIGQDIALMAQQGIDEVALSGGGGSSAMAHKKNPVLAELLVTLARFNAVQCSGMQHALVHEQERSGAAWALEWMILPQMVMATGRSLTAAHDLVGQITRIGQDA